MWAGSIGGKIIGPFFINSIHSNTYLEVLMDIVGPEIADADTNV